MTPGDKLLLRSLYAFNYMRNQRVARDKTKGGTYSLAAMIEEEFRGRGIDPYAPEIREEAMK